MPQRRHTLWTGDPRWEGKSFKKKMYCKQCNEIPWLPVNSSWRVWHYAAHAVDLHFIVAWGTVGVACEIGGLCMRANQHVQRACLNHNYNHT